MRDKDDFFLYRDGQGVDPTLARKLIDNAGGPSGFKTRIQEIDGGTMLVRTKGGMPQVEVTLKPTTAKKSVGANVLTEIDFLLRTYYDPRVWSDCSINDIIGVFFYPQKEVIFTDKDSQQMRTIYQEPPP